MTNGGLSFVLEPTGDKLYDFWVYICPMTAEFSAKTARKKLERLIESGIAPWSSIVLDGQVLLSLLTDALVNIDLHTEVGGLLAEIEKLNNEAALKWSGALMKSAKEEYEND